MPKSIKNQYTQKQFEKDLNELELLIKENSLKGGKNNNENNKNNKNNENNENNEDDENDENDENDEMEGGKKEYTGEYRHFKMVEADGKPVKSNARADIKEHQTPLNAAKKLLTSMVKKEKLTDNAKTKLKVIFYIQETNRDSKSKIYGPYVGTYHKYTPSEAAKAKSAKGKVSFKFKPIVKLYKGNKKEQKGGKQM
jgi:hypothetical protein